MDYTLTRSKRKSLSLRLTSDGTLDVRAPSFCSVSQIEAFIEKNQKWIEKQQAKMTREQKEKGYYLFGELIPSKLLYNFSYQTPPLPSGHLPLLRGGESSINPSLLQEGKVVGDRMGGIYQKEKLEAFYKQQAHAYIIPRCLELASEYGFRFQDIRITSAKTRWGSCSSKKNLNFSYRLVMSPKDCIDYVIIHELCHLREMNHGPRFWKQVSQIMPEYQQYEQHLKEFSWRYCV